MRRPPQPIEIRNGIARCPACPGEPLSLLWRGWPIGAKAPRPMDYLREVRDAEAAVRRRTKPGARVGIMECDRGHRFAMVTMAYRLLDRKADGTLARGRPRR